jgi:hypothetical protein
MAIHPAQRASMEALMRLPAWKHRACARTDLLGRPLNDPDLWFDNPEKAKPICIEHCPLLEACAAHARGGDGWREHDGVWGGLDVEQRDAFHFSEVRRRNRARARAQEDRPQPEPEWRLTAFQAHAVQTLRDHGDLRTAATAEGHTYSSLRWAYSAVCIKLGYHPDDLTAEEFLALVDQAAGHSSLASAA